MTMPRFLLFLLGMLWMGVSGCSAPSVEEHNGHDESAEQTRADHGGDIVEVPASMLEHMQLRTAPVSLRVLQPQLETTGQVDFEQNRLAHVSPRIPGRVEEVRADLGDAIRKGQVLTVIDSIELGQAKSTYLQAVAQEDLARQNYEREQGLYAERISSEKEMLAAKAAHLEAVARLRNAEETLRLYGMSDSRIRTLTYEDGRTSLFQVRSPLSGKVVEKHVTAGELVTPERNMFTIADLGHVWLWIDIYERNLRHVHLGDDVEVLVDAFPDAAFKGKVSYLSDQVDVDTRTVRARIDVRNPEEKLRPGMFARIRITDPHPLPGGTDGAPSLVVPDSAVQRDGTEFIVFVPVGEARFERRRVTVGRAAAGFIEILSGLAPTDSVVVEGVFLLKSEVSKEEMGAGHEH